MPVSILECKNRLYCPDQFHLGPQPCTLGHLGSVLSPQCLHGLYCRCIQPCWLLVLTHKLVCSVGLDLKLTLYHVLLCLMIIRLSPELVSHQSSPALVCELHPIHKGTVLPVSLAASGSFLVEQLLQLPDSLSRQCN